MAIYIFFRESSIKLIIITIKLEFNFFCVIHNGIFSLHLKTYHERGGHTSLFHLLLLAMPDNFNKNKITTKLKERINYKYEIYRKFSFR